VSTPVPIAAALLISAALLGCTTSTASPAPSSLEPSTAGAAPSSPAPSATDGWSLVVTIDQLEVPIPIPSPIKPDKATWPPVGVNIDAQRVLSSLAGCTGGPLGGESAGWRSYDVWTLHCVSDSASELVAALRDELARLGATITDEGEITSRNTGNNGDDQTTLHGQIGGVEVWVRVTSLKTH
jgi:hypothetical protein